MEPRSFERGKVYEPSEPVSLAGLQWSRVRLNAERLGFTPEIDSDATASMEPRSFERGKLSALAHFNTLATASMEPRSFERGKVNVSG